MKKKSKANILRILEQFQRTVLEKKPPVAQMIRDVTLMNFKIKPIQGEVAFLDFQNKEFLEVVWSLGKLDEFFERKMATLPDDQQDMFSFYFDSLHKKFQDELNKLSLKQEQNQNSSSALEMEIFKDTSGGRRMN